MPADRRPGMDHPHYQWSPIVNRGKLRWPDGARVALCVIVNLEHMEWTEPEGTFTTLLAGGMGSRGYPDFARTSHREYGHRVGIFRVLDTLEKHRRELPVPGRPLPETWLRDHRPRNIGKPHDNRQHD